MDPYTIHICYFNFQFNSDWDVCFMQQNFLEMFLSLIANCMGERCWELALKATGAEDKFCIIFPNFPKN